MLLAMGQHSTGDFLVQCWPKQIETTLAIDYFSAEICLWAVGQNVQVIS